MVGGPSRDYPPFNDPSYTRQFPGFEGFSNPTGSGIIPVRRYTEIVEQTTVGTPAGASNFSVLGFPPIDLSEDAAIKIDAGAAWLTAHAPAGGALSVNIQSVGCFLSLQPTPPTGKEVQAVSLSVAAFTSGAPAGSDIPPSIVATIFPGEIFTAKELLKNFKTLGLAGLPSGIFIEWIFSYQNGGANPVNVDFRAAISLRTFRGVGE